MATVPAQSLRVSEIKDPTVLFERYGTDEIRAIERKVRGEIEQKKEELRQMVGERYRDLIDAADTIGEMRQCSESVVESIQDMYRYCHKLKQTKHTPPPSGKAEGQKQSQEKFYTMASQIKLLLEVPERIWSSMESSQYLQATQLYLLCCHLHNQLHLEGRGHHYSPVLSRFPILVRQVAAAGHFRSTILLESKSVLRGRAVSDQAIAEALVSTMLLEDSSPRQALADFLLARKASIQHLLNQPQHGAGVKAQVCSLVELLVTTLYQAYAVFYVPPDGQVSDTGLGCGLLFTTLENVTSNTTGKEKKVLDKDMSTGSWFKYLPPSVMNFQPVLRTLAQPIQREQLRDTLQQWIDTCKEDIRSGVSSLLVYVKSLKGLAAIRDAVWELLSSESISQHWSTVCQSLLERPLTLWDDLLQQLFLQRLQAITQEGTEGISSTSRQLLSSALRDLHGQVLAGSFSRGVQYESDVAAFLWSESQGDLLSDAAWVSVSQRSPQQKSGLSMKTQALTPFVQTFCSTLDSKLKAKLEDLQHYLPSENNNKESSETVPVQSTPPINRFMDAGAVEDVLRDHCLACVRDILASVRSELGNAKAKATGPSQLSSVLFMARLCQSMCELCPSLQQCILGKQGGVDFVSRGTPRQGKKLGKGSTARVAEVSPAQAKWTYLKEELLSCSMEAYGIWSSALIKALVGSFAATLHAGTAGSILGTATNWEELEIQEESESGNSVMSKIRLPVQPSWYIQFLLFHLCLEINRVGGHALPKVTLVDILRGCLDQVVSEYEKLTQETQSKDGGLPMTQNRSLQLLFDLRYVSVTLCSRLDEGRSSHSQQDPRIQQVCDALESHIDPFDLDVFTPHLNSNLNRLSQRTSVLLGLLTGTEKQFISRTNNINSQEQYNILPLASSQIRFGLLPLSMTNSRKAKSSTHGADITRPLVAPSSASAPEDSFRPGNLFRQLANQEEESAAPSLFKLGWLSGMAK
ncbi:conserved oligomeric Golgi complex subunit 1 isoform X2 [Triplophysa rosa]|uniref:Conserved oligomeric Golgi complex subunit 1 n=1 Tax=Triplophysa rosa TaxID=992332 RepID=A0A9W7WL19_TRIRA|nr:conserved oligomeric Golgi complex subunit 1 isoform X2 [Triplophysa rosa]KAI7803914.1 putative conserved oligomeric Golgi complex subunit 1 [Triplophysa rosa]